MSSSSIPFADPLWLNRRYSPYYKDSHRRLQKEVRSYIDTHIAPYCEEWEKKGFVPAEVCNKYSLKFLIRRIPDDAQVHQRHAALGYTAVTPFPLAADYLRDQKLPAGIKAEEWDGFHDLILIDEIARCGYLGVIWALGCGNSIGGPPVINFGNEEQKDRFLPGMLTGKVRFCLGVTEPDGLLPFILCIV
jgi:alkylation response protein AidB-like acyl-CoA dehydrogenase